MTSKSSRAAACWLATALMLTVLRFPLCASALAGELNLNGPAGAYSVHVASLRELRYRTVVRQRYDYSCGAAAVATLLTYSYDRPTPEAAPFVAMFRHGNQKKIVALGFSLLDMKDYLTSLGYGVLGIRVTLEQLRRLAVPGIALVEINGYKHFVVIRAVNDTDVLFADPARGMQILPQSRFNKIWDNVLLVIRTDVDKGRAGFNEQAFENVRPRAPDRMIQRRMGEGLSVYTEELATRNLF